MNSPFIIKKIFYEIVRPADNKKKNSEYITSIQHNSSRQLFGENKTEMIPENRYKNNADINKTIPKNRFIRIILIYEHKSGAHKPNRHRNTKNTKNFIQCRARVFEKNKQRKTRYKDSAYKGYDCRKRHRIIYILQFQNPFSEHASFRG